MDWGSGRGHSAEQALTLRRFLSSEATASALQTAAQHPCPRLLSGAMHGSDLAAHVLPKKKRGGGDKASACLLYLGVPQFLHTQGVL